VQPLNKQNWGKHVTYCSSPAWGHRRNFLSPEGDGFQPSPIETLISQEPEVSQGQDIKLGLGPQREAHMAFVRRAIQNTLKGIGFGLLIVPVLFFLGQVVAFYKGPLPVKEGLEIRFVYGCIAGAFWGGMIGFGCTKPTIKNPGISLLLVGLVFTVLTLVFWGTMVNWSGDNVSGDVAAVICFSLLASIICGSAQFSEK